MGRDGQSVIVKASKVLEAYIGGGVQSMSFVELLEATELNRTTLHRTLAELVEHGFLTQMGQRGHYNLGPLLRSVAALAADVSILTVARPHVERLRDECRETVVLAELHNGYVVPVMRADGLHEMRMNQEVGRRYPAHAGGTAKILLSHLAPEPQNRLLRDADFVALTTNTVTDVESLERDLALAARAGVAVTLGERVADALAISAPVFDAGGEVIAALTISGVAARYERGELLDLAIAARRSGEAISTEIGFRPINGAAAGSTELAAADSDARAAFEEMCDAAWHDAA